MVSQIKDAIIVFALVTFFIPTVLLYEFKNRKALKRIRKVAQKAAGDKQKH